MRRTASRTERRASRGASHGPTRAWCGLVGLLVLVALACSAPERLRVILVAADGLDWNVALPLVREGRMPEIERLMREGTWGWLETGRPTFSPVIWTTLATGKQPGAHGIRGFGEKRQEGLRLYTSSDRRSKAFWDIASDHGLRVHVVGWWVTFPVDAINGVMVAQTNTASDRAVQAGQAIRKGSLVDGLPRQVHPVEREEEVFAILRETERAFPAHVRERFGDPARGAGELAARLWRLSEWSLRADAVYAAVASHLAAEAEPFDLLAVYLGSTDVVGHRFWRYMQPDRYAHPPHPDDVDRFGNVIRDAYIEVDRRVGELRRAAAGEATFLVISDHGMHAIRTDAGFPPDARGKSAASAGHFDAPPGVLVAAGPGIRRAGVRVEPARATVEDIVPVGSVFDVAPTLLALLGVPVGEDMRGRVLTRLIDPRLPAGRGEVETVPSHDTTEWLASRARAGRGAARDAERIEQLRELGYIE
jgi:hypothetical protein